MLKEVRPKKEPTQERARETVDAILQSVVQLIQKGDASGLTTTKIAERAGVSVGSLYQYFPSKEAVFGKVIEFYFRHELEFIRQALEAQRGKDGKDGKDRKDALDDIVGDMLQRIFELRRKSVGYERVLMRFFSRAGDFETIAAIDERLVRHIDDLLIDAERRGMVRRTEATAFLLLHLVRTTFIAVTAARPAYYEQPGLFLDDLRLAVVSLLRPR